jgi:ABC-2 type transport system permease protein
MMSGSETQTSETQTSSWNGGGNILGLLRLEFRKLLGFRSVRLGCLFAFLVPVLISFAPDDVLPFIVGANLIVSSGWQVPGFALYTAMVYLLPLLVAVTCAELIGGEVAWGTLRPLLMRPVSRAQIILSKLFVATLYPFLLLAVSLLGGLVGGIRFGFGAFAGGTGLGPGMFQGIGTLEPVGALLELTNGYLIAGLTLAPIAGLAVAFSVRFLNTAAAALATVATVLLMPLMMIFPFITPFLLTTHLKAYAPGSNAANSLALLTIYALLTWVVTLIIFERKDL